VTGRGRIDIAHLLHDSMELRQDLLEAFDPED
jgi:hypothetical protein